MIFFILLEGIFNLDRFYFNSCSDLFASNILTTYTFFYRVKLKKIKNTKISGQSKIVNNRKSAKKNCCFSQNNARWSNCSRSFVCVIEIGQSTKISNGATTAAVIQTKINAAYVTKTKTLKPLAIGKSKKPNCVCIRVSEYAWNEIGAFCTIRTGILSKMNDKEHTNYIHHTHTETKAENQFLFSI